MSTQKLSPTQQAVLSHAIEHTDGKIVWFPENLKGGACTKVLDGLRNRALIAPAGSAWRITGKAYDALGLARPGSAAQKDPTLEADVAKAETAWTQSSERPQVRTRADSKQAEVIKLLQRPEGATVQQICEATDWQAHTVRGFFAGALKKKLGMTLTSDKVKGSDRIYRLA